MFSSYNFHGWILIHFPSQSFLRIFKPRSILNHFHLWHNPCWGSLIRCLLLILKKSILLLEIRSTLATQLNPCPCPRLLSIQHFILILPWWWHFHGRHPTFNFLLFWEDSAHLVLLHRVGDHDFVQVSVFHSGGFHTLFDCLGTELDVVEWVDLRGCSDFLEEASGLSAKASVRVKVVHAFISLVNNAIVLLIEKLERGLWHLVLRNH